jgi:hypothetical protein
LIVTTRAFLDLADLSLVAVIERRVFALSQS